MPLAETAADAFEQVYLRAFLPRKVLSLKLNIAWPVNHRNDLRRADKGAFRAPDAELIGVRHPPAEGIGTFIQGYRIVTGRENRFSIISRRTLMGSPTGS